MTSPAPDLAPHDNKAPAEPGAGSTLIVPLVVWMLIQLAALGLAASGVRLSAHLAQPPQSLALDEMLIAQFVGSALFLRVLFRGWRAWLVLVLIAGPMLMLASTMTAVPLSRVMWLWAQVAAWLTALALWRAAAPRRADVIAAIAMMGSAGGLLLAYLQAEFGPSVGAGMLEAFPLPGAIRHLTAPGLFLPPFLSTGVFSVAALVVLALKSGQSARQRVGRRKEMTSELR